MDREAIQRGLPESPLNLAPSVRDPSPEKLDLFEQLGLLGDELFDTTQCVEHRGVIAAAESLADLGEGQRRELSRQKHADLASLDDGADLHGREDLLERDLEVVRDDLDDVVGVDRSGGVAHSRRSSLGARRGEGSALERIRARKAIAESRSAIFEARDSFGEEIAQREACHLDRQRPTVQVRYVGQAGQRTFELAQARGDLIGEEALDPPGPLVPWRPRRGSRSREARA